MTRTCCIPNCRSSNNSLPQTHLFTVPTETFCAINKKKMGRRFEENYFMFKRRWRTIQMFVT